LLLPFWLLGAGEFQSQQARLGPIQLTDEGHEDACIIGQIMERPVIGHLDPEAPDGMTQIIDLTAGIGDSPLVLIECRFERVRFDEQGISGLMLPATELPRRALEQLPDGLVC
jgi:hypothetical protein